MGGKSSKGKGKGGGGGGGLPPGIGGEERTMVKSELALEFSTKVGGAMNPFNGTTVESEQTDDPLPGELGAQQGAGRLLWAVVPRMVMPSTSESMAMSASMMSGGSMTTKMHLDLFFATGPADVAIENVETTVLVVPFSMSTSMERHGLFDLSSETAFAETGLGGALAPLYAQGWHVRGIWYGMGAASSESSALGGSTAGAATGHTLVALQRTPETIAAGPVYGFEAGLTITQTIKMGKSTCDIPDVAAFLNEQASTSGISFCGMVMDMSAQVQASAEMQSQMASNPMGPFKMDQKFKLLFERTAGGRPEKYAQVIVNLDMAVGVGGAKIKGSIDQTVFDMALRGWMLRSGVMLPSSQKGMSTVIPYLLIFSGAAEPAGAGAGAAAAGPVVEEAED